MEITDGCQIYFGGLITQIIDKAKMQEIAQLEISLKQSLLADNIPQARVETIAEKERGRLMTYIQENNPDEFDDLRATYLKVIKENKISENSPYMPHVKEKRDQDLALMQLEWREENKTSFTPKTTLIIKILRTLGRILGVRHNQY